MPDNFTSPADMPILVHEDIILPSQITTFPMLLRARRQMNVGPFSGVEAVKDDIFLLVGLDEIIEGNYNAQLLTSYGRLIEDQWFEDPSIFGTWFEILIDPETFSNSKSVDDPVGMVR